MRRNPPGTAKRRNVKQGNVSQEKKNRVINEETEDYLYAKEGAEVILLLLKNLVFIILVIPTFIFHSTVKGLHSAT